MPTLGVDFTWRRWLPRIRFWFSKECIGDELRSFKAALARALKARRS